jgi:predicted nucleic acid-binding protein
VSDELLLDNSAWGRFRHSSLPDTRVRELGDAVQEGRILVCLPFLLEAGYSARDLREHEEILDELLELPRLEIDWETESRAFAAQRQLARVGHHRLPPVDIVIAALADLHEIGVLHYDRDFDLIAEKTDLRFESVWLAEPGSL